MNRTCLNRLAADTSEAWRRRVLARGIEATERVRGRRLMVLAPHPDDETLGCGGLIAARRRAGDPAIVVVATDGRHSTRSAVLDPRALAALRHVELHRACTTLGVRPSHVVELGFEDGRLAANRPALTVRLAALLARHRPDLLLVPCAQDHHPDHRALYAAAMRAVLRSGQRPGILAYPIWTWIGAPWFPDAPVARRPGLLTWSMRQLTGRRWWRVPCGEHLPAKHAALRAHASQTGNLTGEPTWSHLTAAQLALFLRPDEPFLPVCPR